MHIQIEHGNIFEKTKRAYDAGNKVIIHRGGTGSGKTFEIMIFLFWLLGSKVKNKVFTVVSESRPHLDIGCIRIAKLLTNNPLGSVVRFNETKAVFNFPSGNVLEFFSADRIDKALGARRHLLYGNEINSLKLEVWDELARRSEIVIGDFNPMSQFWLEEWIQYYDLSTVITSNHLDNPFLPATERARIMKRALMDANFKRIHIDCEYGIFDGLIFTEWQQIDEMPEGDVKYGMDFGYTNNPTTLIACIETPEAYYFDGLIYQTGLTNRNIAKLFEAHGIKKRYDEIFADSAEPKSIDEIRMYGYNVKPAKKGADSVAAGISRLKSKKIYITKRSVDAIRELRNYSWQSDKDGRSTNKPIGIFNHSIDAMRYAIGLPEWMPQGSARARSAARPSTI